MRNAAEISLVVIVFLFGLIVITQIQDVLVLFFLSLFLAAVMEPGVVGLQSIGIRMNFGILLHYAAFIGLIAFFLIAFIPIIADQLLHIGVLTSRHLGEFLVHPAVSLPFVSDALNNQLTGWAQSVLQNLSIERLPDALMRIGASLSPVAGGSLGLIVAIAGSLARFIADVVIVFLFTFFLLTGKNRHYAWIRGFFPLCHQTYIDAKVRSVHQKLSQWVRGQLLLCLCIGCLTYIVLIILQVPYALTLSILAGVMEAVPYVGPFFAGVPAVLIAMGQGGITWGFIVGFAYYSIQFLENNFIVPVVMKHSVDLSAVAVLFALLLGVSFPSIVHPILGILLSIPIAAILSIFLEDLQGKDRQEEF